MFSLFLFICKRLDVVEVYTYISYIGIVFECLPDSKDNFGQSQIALFGGMIRNIQISKKETPRIKPRQRLRILQTFGFPRFFMSCCFPLSRPVSGMWSFGGRLASSVVWCHSPPSSASSGSSARWPRPGHLWDLATHKPP